MAARIMASSAPVSPVCAIVPRHADAVQRHGHPEVSGRALASPEARGVYLADPAWAIAGPDGGTLSPDEVVTTPDATPMMPAGPHPHDGRRDHA
jgi:hypothetical protein